MILISIVDLELYCCKFYDKDIEVKHTYFLIIPTDKDNTSIDINYNPNVQPINDAVKQWLRQSWYHHSVIEKYRLIQPKTVFPYQAKTPLKNCGQSGQRKVKTSAIHHYSSTSIMTRSNRRKNCKRVKKLIKKLRYDCFNLEKHYNENITKLHMQLLDKEYYLSSILDFMKGYYRSPWDTAVYRGFRNMCFDDN